MNEFRQIPRRELIKGRVLSCVSVVVVVVVIRMGEGNKEAGLGRRKMIVVDEERATDEPDLTERARGELLFQQAAAKHLRFAPLPWLRSLALSGRGESSNPCLAGQCFLMDGRGEAALVMSQKRPFCRFNQNFVLSF